MPMSDQRSKASDLGKLRLPKSPFRKGGFRGIFSTLTKIPPAPLYERGDEGPTSLRSVMLLV